MEWLPIEFAPRDGTEILAVVIDAIDVVAWDGDGFYEASHIQMHPDYWMPLPKPPPRREWPHQKVEKH